MYVQLLCVADDVVIHGSQFKQGIYILELFGEKVGLSFEVQNVDEFLIGKVWKKLTSWGTRHLSFAEGAYS